MIREVWNLSSASMHREVKIITIGADVCQVKKVLILLHGRAVADTEEHRFKLIEAMPDALDMEKLCKDFGLLIAIPYVENHYYISAKEEDYDTLIAVELPDAIKERYHISSDVEAILGGISMGAYGALLIGAHTGRFQDLVCLSGAFVQNAVRIGSDDVWCMRKPHQITEENSFLYRFLPLHDLDESRERNVVPALSMFSERQQDPFILMICGEQDGMYDYNCSMEKHFKELGLRYRFLKEIGGHVDACFKKELRKAMEILLG